MDDDLHNSCPANNSNNFNKSPARKLDEDPYGDNSKVMPHHVSHDRANSVFKSFGVSKEEVQKS